MDKVKPKPPAAGLGRPRGAVNKRTREQREIAAVIIANNEDKVQGWLDRTARRNPAKATELFLRFLEFVKPKLARSMIQAEISQVPPPSLGILFTDGGPGCDHPTTSITPADEYLELPPS